MTRHHGPSGRELAARREAKGWTQRQLAEAAGVGRTAVQYWEAADHLDPDGWAAQRMARALGWYLGRFRDSLHDTHGRGDGLLDLSPAMQAWASAQLAHFDEREAARAARRRVVCGARTRKGTPLP